MSRAEWGVLSEPTIPAPDADEPSAAARRADRADGSADLSRYGLNWNLTGFGEPGDDCGLWVPAAVCNECGHADMVRQSCDRWMCPDCWARAANRAAVSGSVRLQSYRYQQPDDYRRQWAHAVVSPPDGDIETKREFFDGRSDAADLAMGKGFRGCAVIAHPWRTTEFADDLYDDADADFGKWVWVRKVAEAGRFELSELIRWSPHYHIIGPTSPDMQPGESGDEWRYNLIRFNSEQLHSVSDDDSHEEVFGMFRYLYSHVGKPEDCDRQLTTWHGELANSVFVESATEDWQVQKPSEGVRDAIERRIKELTGPTVENDDGDGVGDGTDDEGPCPRDDCDGVLIDVWDCRTYLTHNDPPPEVVNTMRTCREWREGEIQPPPGLKRPMTEQDARDALEALL